jgi:hypothetical protein
MYRITFSKIGKFLMYQVWNKDNTMNQNDKRAVFNLSAKKWVNIFIKVNKDLKEDGNPLFTPTTIMETEDEEQYAFVIRNVYFDSHKRVVFTVSTKEIYLANNCSKDLIQIPCGNFTNMRFDIDDWWSEFGNFFTKTIPANITPVTNPTINLVPSGLRNNDALNGPLCWGINQLDVRQQISLADRFYIGVSIPYDEKFYKRDDGGPYVYTCRSYGQLND